MSELALALITLAVSGDREAGYLDGDARSPSSAGSADELDAAPLRVVGMVADRLAHDGAGMGLTPAEYWQQMLSEDRVFHRGR